MPSTSSEKHDYLILPICRRLAWTKRVYAGCTYIDKVEFECIKLAKKLFRAEFADVRPISVVANLAIYSGFTNPGDIMLTASIPAGGHISHGKKEHFGTAGLVHGLNIEFYPFDAQEMTIDVDKTKQKVKTLKKEGRLPKMAMFGGSLFLFPHPVKELADFLKGYDMHINYDAAHVAGLIAGNEFQDPIGATLTSVPAKLDLQIRNAEIINAVDPNKTVSNIVSTHLVPDIMGNLRSYNSQIFRCTKCDRKYRRPPLSKKCVCGNTPIGTISRAGVEKYLGFAIRLVDKYDVGLYQRGRIHALADEIKLVFGQSSGDQSLLSDFEN